MNLSQYKKISAQVNADLTAVLAKHGFKVTKLNASIEAISGTLRLTIGCADTNHKDASGAVTTPEREYYKQFCTMYDMKPEWLGDTVTFSGEKHTIAGMKNTRSDKCILVERTGDHSMRIATPEMVKRAMLAKILEGAK